MENFNIAVHQDRLHLIQGQAANHLLALLKALDPMINCCTLMVFGDEDHCGLVIAADFSKALNSFHGAFLATIVLSVCVVDERADELVQKTAFAIFAESKR